MGGELVDGRDGEEEMLSGGPWSTFWSENRKADSLSGHQFRESVSRRRDISIRWRHQTLDLGRHARMLSQQRRLILSRGVFGNGVQVGSAHFKTEGGDR